MTDKCRSCAKYKRIEWDYYPFFLFICTQWKRSLCEDELDGCPEFEDRDK